MKRLLLVAAASVIFSGCYHATINTGVEPATPPQTQWKHSFIYGLVPMSPTDAAAICGERAIARIETKQPFIQGLVSGLTGGIYTPWEVSVTCGSVPPARPATWEVKLPKGPTSYGLVSVRPELRFLTASKMASAVAATSTAPARIVPTLAPNQPVSR